MKRIVKKLIIVVITLFTISILTFAAFHIIPGDPAMQILGTEASPERLAALREKLGTDKSLPNQYLNWLKGLASGNFGVSIKYNKPVKDLIADRIPVTVALSLMSMLLILIISIPVGLYCGKKKRAIVNECINTVTMISISFPNFFLGILFIWIFGLSLRFFIPGGYISYSDDFIKFIKYLFYPALAIAIPNIAVIIKFLRSSILCERKLDYVRTALGKGNTENRVLYRHILKNAIVPVIPILGMMVGDIFSGSIIIEQVFSIPGLGKLLIAAISARDYPLIQTLVVLIAFIVVLSNSLVDVILQILDPRIRIE